MLGLCSYRKTIKNNEDEVLRLETGLKVDSFPVTANHRVFHSSMLNLYLFPVTLNSNRMGDRYVLDYNRSD